MAGGLLNIISEGNNNVILTGTPTKTFFKVAYSKYTNFGLQKFRLDYDGQRELRLSEESNFKFKIKRYAELLMDTYVVVTLPNIWSPLYEPSVDTDNRWAPYDFRWIKNIGTHMIKEISINCGSVTLQKYTGEYLAAMVERDFSKEKKELFNNMTGNTEEFYNPALAFGKINTYPAAYYQENNNGVEPSIRGRTLYIPINSWFTLDSRCAFPLISLQYAELEISVTFRPIQDLFQIRDIFDSDNDFPYVRPDFNRSEHQMYRFLQSPPHTSITEDKYENKIGTWNADIHLLATYGFLSNDESELFASKEQVYLIKDVYNYNFQNVTGSKRVKLLSSSGMVSNWMFYLQRNDVKMRNEWSNYTNWPYMNPPIDIGPAPLNGGPGENPGGQPTGYFITGKYSPENRKEILETMGILLNGEYRENSLPRGVFDYVEKYVRTQGFATDGIYCYNFSLNSSPFEYQPSGAINMSKFKSIELEITTYVPQYDEENSNFKIICDNDGNPIGVNKQNWRLFEYQYDLTLFEERYNVLSFTGGTCGLLYAR
jgi:hypothetical protein